MANFEQKNDTSIKAHGVGMLNCLFSVYVFVLLSASSETDACMPSILKWHWLCRFTLTTLHSDAEKDYHCCWSMLTKFSNRKPQLIHVKKMTDRRFMMVVLWVLSRRSCSCI